MYRAPQEQTTLVRVHQTPAVHSQSTGLVHPYHNTLLVMCLEGVGAKTSRVLIMPRYLIVIRFKFHAVSPTC